MTDIRKHRQNNGINGNLNSTLMDLPNIPNLGNEMDKTVRFNSNDRKFINGSVGLTTTNFD
jgi:hypothetical protein